MSKVVSQITDILNSMLGGATDSAMAAERFVEAVRAALEEYDRATQRKVGYRISQRILDAAIADWRSGMSKREAARKHNISDFTLRHAIKKLIIAEVTPKTRRRPTGR